jgi:hypothetical protein
VAIGGLASTDQIDVRLVASVISLFEKTFLADPTEERRVGLSSTTHAVQSLCLVVRLIGPMGLLRRYNKAFHVSRLLVGLDVALLVDGL